MKHYLLFILLLPVGGNFSLMAQNTNFSIFKVTVYAQTSGAIPATPDAPNAYYFGAQFGTADSSDYLDVYFIPPGDPAGPVYLNEMDPYYFNFGSPYYASQSDFDADYPSGQYYFYVDRTNFVDQTSFTDSGSVTLPAQEFYAAAVAGFTPDCWTAMQQVDPAQDFTLNWNAFVPDPVTTAAFTFIDIYDQTAGTEPYAADFLTPDTMTTNIPANTLQYGVTYRINNIFSSRQDTPDAGFGGAVGTVGLDNLTYTTLVTLPPWLQISAANTNVILTWPALATNFVLQCVRQLPPAGVWTVTTNVPVTAGSTNVLTLPTTGSSRFFRLSSLNSP